MTFDFWKSALERAFKTALQVVVALAAAGPVFDVLAFDWTAAGTTALSAFVLSVLTSALSAPFGDKGTPSAVSDGR